MQIGEIVSRFSEPPEAIGLGISALEALANEDLSLAEAGAIAVPDNLLRLATLVRKGSAGHRDFLVRVIRYFRGRAMTFRHQDDDGDHRQVRRIVAALWELERAGRLLVIHEAMVDPRLETALGPLYPGATFEIALSPLRNFLRDYLVRVYSWTEGAGCVAVERTRRVFSDLGHHVATLQFPDQLDRDADLKGRYVSRAFASRRGRRAGFLVGVTADTEGQAGADAGVAGLVIAFADL